MSVFRVFFALSAVVTVNATHRPSGEICGSPRRRIAMRSSKVKGRPPAAA
jgi:hypothetical protein